jgi:hypothetical protein
MGSSRGGVISKIMKLVFVASPLSSSIKENEQGLERQFSNISSISWREQVNFQ